MITPGQLYRIVSIQRTLIRYGFDEILFTTPLLQSVSFLLILLPWNWRNRTYAPQAERIRQLLEELGPIFVKFGQIISTRRDLLPDDIANELSNLQDNVPPFPGEKAREIVEQALGLSLDEAFASFDTEPLASASIAQVHKARLHDGSEVIVKVVRPGIRKTIARDLGLMKVAAEMAEKYWPDGRRMKPTNVVREFEKTILDELDLMREGANASQLQRNFAGSRQMYVPQVHWKYTRRNVMVMERIHGIPVDDVAELKAADYDLKQLAEDGVAVFFTQVFRHHYFHADLHPGNLFVIPGAEAGDPARFAPVDFGIMGSLSEFDQRYLAENFAAFLNRDYRRVAELHMESGWVPPETRVDEFEFAIRAVCEPIFDRPMKELSIGELLLRLFQTARRFNVEIMPQMLLLQKTIVNVEGLGRQLYPDLDLWAAARPSLESWVEDRTGIHSLLDTAKSQAPVWADRLPKIPGLMFATLEQLRSGKLKVQTDDAELRNIRAELKQIHNRLVYALIGAGALIGAAVMQALHGGDPIMIGPAPLSAWILGLGGVAALVLAWRD